MADNHSKGRFDVKSEEALAWVAGFFCGEGSISINKYLTGLVGMGQRTCAPLDVIYEVLVAHGIDVSEPRYCESGHYFELTLSCVKGSEFLQLIASYPMKPKLRKRAEIYLKMFAPSKRHKQRSAERQRIYTEWLQLRIDEKQE